MPFGLKKLSAGFRQLQPTSTHCGRQRGARKRWRLERCKTGYLLDLLYASAQQSAQHVGHKEGKVQEALKRAGMSRTLLPERELHALMAPEKLI